MAQRNYYIDLAKGIGILFVVLSHNKNPLNPYIYSFHMPLFFLLSGIFHPTNQELKTFVKKRVQRLLVPYFCFSTVLFLFWFLLARRFGGSASQDTSVFESFMGIFMGTQINGISNIVWGGTLWFLPCLFLVGCMYHLISRYSIKYIILFNIAAVLLNLALTRIFKTLFPWSFLTALMALPFYTFGNLFKTHLQQKPNNNHFWTDNAVLFILSISTFFLGSPFGINMASNRYYNGLLFFIGGFAGSLLIINLVKLIPKDRFKWINYLGMNTLVIFAFHLRAQTVIKYLWPIFFHQEFVEGSILFAILYAFLEILLCIPLIYIINRYLPFCIGKSVK